MRYFNFVIALLMLLFAAVQYNDPDGWVWVLIYLVPAVWAIISAIRLSFLRSPVGSSLLTMCIALSIVGLVYFWPKLDSWWQPDVFLQEISGETAREGMGMMVVLIVLIILKVGARRRP